MSQFLRQSTASQSRAIGPFVDDTDFKTAETGLTIANTDIKLMSSGGASANKNSGGGTHRVNGVYGVTFDATDTATVGELMVSVVVSGALPVFHTFYVLEEAVFDALFAASAPGYVANAPVNVAQFGGSNGTFASGRPEVNTTHAAGTAWGSGAITSASIASGALTSIAAAVWDRLTSALSTASSIGKLLVDNVTASISAVKAKTDNLPASPAAVSDIPTANAIADQVWDEVLSGHLTGGSTGAGLNAAGAAGDPWSTSLPGAYGAGTAGKIIGDNLNATVSSRASQATADAIETDTQDIQTRIGTVSNLGGGATLAANLADIEAQTDDIGAAGAGLTALASAASLATVAGYLDTEIADIQSRLPAALVGGKMDANVGAISGDTVAADNLEAAADGTGYNLGGGSVVAASVTAGVTVSTNNDKAGYAIGVGGIGATAFAAGAIDNAAISANAIGASELAQDAAREIADEVLDRDIAGGASGGARNVRSALRRLRNRARVSGGTATVYQEDDTTAAWTAAVTTAAGDPVSEVDPT